MFTPKTAPFVVLEGLDGVGKSTLAARLTERLDAVLLHTPPDALAPQRASIVAALGGGIAETLFYAATVVAASERAREACARGRAVVLDRYWSSTCSYAEVRGATVQLAELERRLFPATLTVYLEARTETRAARFARRVLTEGDRASLALEQSLRRAYERALAGPWNGAVLRLATDERGPDELLEAVLRALEEPSDAPNRTGPTQSEVLQ